jgi:hypothetical protein
VCVCMCACACGGGSDGGNGKAREEIIHQGCIEFGSVPAIDSQLSGKKSRFL